MKSLIKSYLDDMRLAWTPATARSEYYRLSSVAEVLDGTPSHLWNLLLKKNLKPYTRLTYWTRVCKFWDWLIEQGKKNGPNPYRRFREKNARAFRHVYERRSPKLSFEETNKKINEIKDPESMRKAKELLQTGMRYAESFTFLDGYVVGKGGKRRRVFSNKSISSTFEKSYSTFRRRLKEVGLKPHDLRKICLTELVKRGANEFELCTIAGWNNINTASSYIRSDESRLKTLMKDLNE